MPTIPALLGAALLCAGGLLGPAAPAAAETPQAAPPAATAPAARTVRIDWLERQVTPPPVLSNLAPPPPTRGRDGAALGIEDISTTGRFTGLAYDLRATVVPPEAAFLPAAEAVLAGGARLVIVRAPAADLLALADLAARIAPEALLFNAGAPQDALRGADCRANVLHTLPALGMRTDALAQFLTLRKWDKLAMVRGAWPEDRELAETMTRSLAKFGLSLEGDKEWAFDANMRRAAAAEAPLFTQDLPDHDVLLVADDRDDFARYLPYNTWDARPLALSEGLVPVGWSGVVEQNGAAQLQNRFREDYRREMEAADFAAWAAVAAIGEAATRTGGGDPAALRAYMLGPEFRLGGFLGRPLSFRAWDGQMRQPIPLVTPRAVVALAPLEGFLHPVSELDTLGADAPETQCTAFGGRP